MKILFSLIQKATPFIPVKLRTFARKYVGLVGYDIERRKASNPFLNEPEKIYPKSPLMFGIIEDVAQFHKHYIYACRDMGLSYKVMSILDDRWISNFHRSECDAFLVWPSAASTVYKQVFDYRLKILECDMGMTVYPSWLECWLTEHKPRLRDWMEANGIPHPKTWVFHDIEAALGFAESASLPLVFKTATGASASGIRVIKCRRDLAMTIHHAFGRGFCPRGYDPLDRQRAFAFFQEYLAEVDEWRMVRIGDSFFGYRKERGQHGLHSASHNWSWLDPGEELLNLLKMVTEKGGFTSMDVDVFRTKGGRLLVNECQTVFGCSTPAVQMKINGVEGRYTFNTGGWRFETGSYSENHMCNLRLAYLIDRMAQKKNGICIDAGGGAIGEHHQP